MHDIVLFLWDLTRIIFMIVAIIVLAALGTAAIIEILDLIFGEPEDKKEE